MIARRSDDAALEGALRDLGPSLERPAGTELRALVRGRVAVMPAPGSSPSWWGWRGRLGGIAIGRPPTRPLRLALVVAVLAVALLAAVVGAAVLGVPGIRIFFGPAPSIAPTAPGPSPVSSAASSPSPSPTASVLGGDLDLGQPVAVASLDQVAGFHVRLPSAGTLGPPAAAWYDPTALDGLATLVWPSGTSLPASGQSRVGLLIAEFKAGTDSSLFEKFVNGPGTTLEDVTVDGTVGWWIGGVHELAFVARDGTIVPDRMRLSGPVLLWSRDGTTYRIESSLPRDTVVAIADGLR